MNFFNFLHFIELSYSSWITDDTEIDLQEIEYEIIDNDLFLK